MPTLFEDFNWGSFLENQNPELTRQLSTAYSDIAVVTNTKVSKYVTDGDKNPHVNPPASSDFNKNFELGDMYVRSDTDSVWVMTSRTTDIAVTWTAV